MRELIRKAGDAIRSFDDAYAQKVLKGPPLTAMLGGAPLTYGIQPSPAKELAMGMAAELKGPASKDQIQRHQAIEYAMGAGLMATSAGYRYGLPAAGVTLAGVGIHELAQKFGGPGDTQEPNQLSLS